MVGSWEEGTVMTILLNGAMPFADVLNTFGGMYEVEAIADRPLTQTVSPGLLKRAASVPALRNRVRKTIYITLEKNGAVNAS
jgi:hypothetical protein